MQAQLLNTETNQTFTLAYLPLELELGAIEASYVMADIPYTDSAIASWSNTQQRESSFQLTLDGKEVRDRVSQLQNLTKPVSKKKSPPVCILRLGLLSPVSVVITAVRPIWDLTRFDRQGNPTRAKVTIEYLPVGQGAIS